MTPPRSKLFETNSVIQRWVFLNAETGVFHCSFSDYDQAQAYGERNGSIMESPEKISIERMRAIQPPLEDGWPVVTDEDDYEYVGNKIIPKNPPVSTPASDKTNSVLRNSKVPDLRKLIKEPVKAANPARIVGGKLRFSGTITR